MSEWDNEKVQRLEQENRYLKWRLSRAEHSINSMAAGVTAIVQDAVAHATRIQKMGNMAFNNAPSGNAPDDRFITRIGFSSSSPQPPEGYDGPMAPPTWVTPDGKRFYSSWSACEKHCPEYTYLVSGIGPSDNAYRYDSVHEDEQGDGEE